MAKVAIVLPTYLATGHDDTSVFAWGARRVRRKIHVVVGSFIRQNVPRTRGRSLLRPREPGVAESIDGTYP